MGMETFFRLIYLIEKKIIDMKMCKLCMEKEYMEYPKAHFWIRFKYTFQAIK